MKREGRKWEWRQPFEFMKWDFEFLVEFHRKRFSMRKWVWVTLVAGGDRWVSVCGVSTYLAAHISPHPLSSSPPNHCGHSFQVNPLGSLLRSSSILLTLLVAYWRPLCEHAQIRAKLQLCDLPENLVSGKILSHQNYSLLFFEEYRLLVVPGSR